MELELSSDQEVFAETTQKFLDDEVPVAELRALRSDPTGWRDGYWQKGAQLGWTSLLVSEEHGGGSISGNSIADLALVAFQFGRHAAPGPIVPANIVAGAISRSGTAEQISDILPQLIAGEGIGAWAYSEPRPNDALGAVTLEATVSGEMLRLNGVKSPVEAGAQATHLLVTARAAEGLVQVFVPADTEGVSITPMQGLDLTRRYAKVALNGVELPISAVVGQVGGAETEVDWQLRVAIALQLQEMVGAMDKAFEMTVQWAFDRYSFGRPLASYQELKHRFADMKLWLEASHAIADATARAVGEGAPNAWDLLSAGKSYIGDHGVDLMQDCVQMHGGIGVTFDHDLHLYLRRVTVGSRQFGSVAEHRERLTAALEASVVI